MTPAFLVACVVVFVLQKIMDPGGNTGGFESRFWVIGGAGGELFYRSITYAFLHGDWMHLIGNMLFLWVFGRPVEDKLGRIGFTVFYLAGAAASGLAHAWLELGPAIGASGAVSAVTGAFLVLFPKTRIRVLWFMILISMLNAPAWFFIGLQIAWNVLAQTTGQTGNVAVIAHLAGYAFGFVVAFTLLSTGILAREPYDLFSMSKQAKRRQDFRAAARLNNDRKGPSKHSLEPKPLDARAEAIATARANVSAALSNNQIDEAVGAYRALLDAHSDDRAAVTLPRNAQYRLGTHLAAEGNDELAMRVFDDFLGAFPNDPEGGQIRILLARLCKKIGATGRARRLLDEAVETLTDEDLRALAEAERDALPAETRNTENGEPA